MHNYRSRFSYLVNKIYSIIRNIINSRKVNRVNETDANTSIVSNISNQVCQVLSGVLFL